MRRAATRGASLLLMAGVLGAFLMGRAEAGIIKGSFIFLDDAFADSASALSASVVPMGGATTLEEAVTGPDLGTYITEFDEGEVFRIEFIDNVITNGPGDDLVVFELGLAEAFKVAVYKGPSVPPAYTLYVPVDVGVIDGAPMNAAYIDLADLGEPDGAVVTRFVIRSDAPNGAEISGAAGLPEPATLVLVGWGTAVGLISRRRRRRRR